MKVYFPVYMRVLDDILYQKSGKYSKKQPCFRKICLLFLLNDELTRSLLVLLEIEIILQGLKTIFDEMILVY